MEKDTKQKDITIDEVKCNRQQIGECSEAEGCSTESIGDCSHAEGCCTEAEGTCSHSEGCCTKSEGDCSHSEGTSIKINGFFTNTKSMGKGAHAEGGGALAGGDYSHAEGGNTFAGGVVSHAEGSNTKSTGFASHAEGCDSEASGENSHAEGNITEASGENSHAEGLRTTASGIRSHAEGFGPTASGFNSHAEGFVTIASGDTSHAEGNSTIASGENSHAEGNSTTASGIASHAEGNRTEASGDASHAEGNDTSTAGLEGAHIMGQFGDACEDYGWFMAGGTDTVTRAVNACIKNSGDAFFTSVSTVDPCCADYAEMFETVDGEAIDVGYFVTFDKDQTDKIRRANKGDSFILGVTSATPAILAGATDYTWQNRYIRDNWGRIQYETVVTPEVKGEDGKVIIPEKEDIKPIINPEYNCKQCYKPRSKRPEWVAVGLVGQVLIRDDGTCIPGGYCKPNRDGVATHSPNGYRVIKRTDENQVLILYK